MIKLAQRKDADEARRVGILYENDAWLADLFERLTRRQIPYTPIRMDDAAVVLERPPAYPLVFNRVSPSSYVRGHGPAIPFTVSLLDFLSAHGCRVINPASSFAHETSKVAQLLLFKRLGVAAPRSILFNNRRQIAALARDFPFPALIKPNCGGSGALIRGIKNYDHLISVLADNPDPFGPNHMLILQQQIIAADGAVIRTEFIDGEFVYAMRVLATNTFNLCPADTCERHAADSTVPDQPRVEFEPYLDIPPDAVAQAREIVRAAHLDVGGVEFIESADGKRWFLDINATSFYRADICDAVRIKASDKLMDFIERELHKELAKRSHGEFLGRAARAPLDGEAKKGSPAAGSGSPRSTSALEYAADGESSHRIVVGTSVPTHPKRRDHHVKRGSDSADAR